MRLAQRMGVGAGWTAGTCVPLHRLQRYTSSITLSNFCCLNLTSPFTWFTKKSSGHSQVFCFSMARHALLARRDGHMEKSPSSVHHGHHVWRVRLCSTAGRNKDAFNQVKEKSQRSCRGHTGVSVEPASSICDFSWNNTLFRWLFWHQCENCTNSKAKKENMTGSNCVLPSISFLWDFMCVWLVVLGLADWFQRPHAPFASLSCQEIVWHFWGGFYPTGYMKILHLCHQSGWLTIVIR